VILDSLYVAWRYVVFQRGKTATLVGCITLIAFLPLALELLLAESERQLTSRASDTPLVVGARGSTLDLVMNTLYFDDEQPAAISMAATQRVLDSDLALPVPVYVRFRARGFPIVGITLDYFDFRGLEMAQGRTLAVLGDCVLGATVAERLGLGPGDSLLSAPESVFDLAGVYPLKMRVAGVLARAHTSDDLAVFVDLKSAWVIQGIGHGHQDLAAATDPTVIMKRDDANVVATAKLALHTEITEANRESFHFHGAPDAYPLTAVIVVPPDQKSATILRGRYLSADERDQIVVPGEVVAGLLESIFRIKNVLDAVILIVALATVLAIVLVFALSLRLREREIQTIFKLGCSRSTVARLLGSEILIIVCASAVIVGALMISLDGISNGLVRGLIIR